MTETLIIESVSVELDRSQAEAWNNLILIGYSFEEAIQACIEYALNKELTDAT